MFGSIYQSFKLEELLKDIIWQLYEGMNFPIPARVESMNTDTLKAKINGFLQQVANGYLNELVNRSMIQVDAFTRDGRVKTCRIHDLIRDFIISKSKDQIRSISILNNTANVKPLQISESQLRSLLMFGFTDSLHTFTMPSFFSTRLKLLIVLDLGGAPLEKFPEDIVQLFNLKYLSLRDTKVSRLPNSIGNLRNLETLDLKRSNIIELPANILQLKRLRHLLLYHYNHSIPLNSFPGICGFKALPGIGTLTFLQKLNTIEANPCSRSIVEEIGKLTQLTRLGITHLRKEDGKTLCSSIQKLSHLRSLTLQSIDEKEIIDLENLSKPPPYLRMLQLNGRLEKLPDWINSDFNVAVLFLKWSHLKNDILESLGALPNLVCLYLHAAYDEEILCFKKGSFRSLKKLFLQELEHLSSVTMEDDSLPKLETLYIGRCQKLDNVPLGIKTLTKLNLLQFWEMPENLINTIKSNQENDADSMTLPRVEVMVYSEDGPSVPGPHRCKSRLENGYSTRPGEWRI